MAEPDAFAIDIFAVFGNSLMFRGWVCDAGGVKSLQLRIGARRIPLDSFGKIDSADVEKHHGAKGRGSRFEEIIAVDPGKEDITAAELVITCRDARVREIKHLGFPRGQHAHILSETFKAMLHARPAGACLEVGSRARSGVVRREWVPGGWSYVGLDIVKGPNVDVVADAHELTTALPGQKFDAVMAFSVVEHLMMPWKFVVELNRVLNMGAIGKSPEIPRRVVQRPRLVCREYPDRAWPTLLNRATGFEVLDARMGEPTYFVAQRCHAVTNFGMNNIGYLASNVIFKKVAETDLQWPVSVRDIADTKYPTQ
jgi:hypothetical protein